jgi:NADH dehydrogenase [ubiquinone] 1 alpha subcomplex assembly factor 6
MPDSDLDYCAQSLRRQDHERYLTALFAPANRRNALFALYAFNQELARARESVREPIMGLMRLQWWRDSLGEIYAGRTRDHAVARPLGEAITAYGLPQAEFERLIATRERDMDTEPPADLPALLAYAEGTAATLNFLALKCLGEPAVAVEEAGKQIGIAWALVGLARAVPFHTSQRRLYLPAALMAERKLSTTELFDRGSAPQLRGIIEALAREANNRIRQARSLRPEVPRRFQPVLLQASLAAGHLRRLAAAGYDPFDARVQQPPPGRIWGLAARRLLGGY